MNVANCEPITIDMMPITLGGRGLGYQRDSSSHGETAAYRKFGVL